MVRIGFLVAALAAGPGLSAATTENLDQIDLTALELEDLMEIEVTVAGKKQQRFGDLSAAAHIIDREDIRRSGATTIPEALRLIPGLEVGQLNAGVWAISARGFGVRFAAKMLVLIDGRSTYTPLFSGVYWDVQDVLLEDVHRIEVVRGPGATLWGANAVNGVINIITRSAADTQGGYVSVLGGDEEAQGGFRYGAALGSGGHYRVYAKHLDADAQAAPDGSAAGDGWELTRTGFRMDWDAGTRNVLTLQGDAYDGESVSVGRYPSFDAPYTRVVADRNRVDGFNLLGRITRDTRRGDQWILQAYVDDTDRRSFQVVESRRTYDLDGQFRVSLGRRHDLVAGVGVRETRDRLERTETAWVEPDRRSDTLVNVFVQDDIRVSERMRLTVGSKFEHNDYSGFEIQPNVRGHWTLGDNASIWAAVSRAIRSPVRALSDVRLGLAGFPSATPGLSNQVVLFGNPDFRSEVLIAWEVGYRGCRGEHCIDLATFYNDYDRLLTIEPRTPYLETDPVPHVVIPQTLDNLREGESLGAEISYDRRLSRRWFLTAWYAYFHMHTRTTGGGRDSNDPPEWDSPEHRAQFSLDVQLPRKFDAGIHLYYVDRLPGWEVPAYTRADARLSWSPRQAVQASLVLQNLFDTSHIEYDGDLFLIPTRVERSVHGKVAWRF